MAPNPDAPVAAPALMDGEAYRASLRDGRRIIDAAGNAVADVTTHPALAAGVDTIARYYDAQHDPSTRDILTYEDSNGRRAPIAWMIPRSKDELRRRREACRFSTYHTLGTFGRPPDYGPLVPIGFLAILDRIAGLDPEWVANVHEFIRWGTDANVMSCDLVADVQSDRRIPVAAKPGRLRAVKETAEGIVLYGAKPCASVAAQGHVGTIVTALTPGADPDAALNCWVPLNSDGLTMVTREPVAAAGDRSDHPADALGEEPDTILLFDHVFIPRTRIFSFRQTEMLPIYYTQGVLPQWHILSRMAYKAEIFAGTGQLVAEVLGTAEIPQVRDGIAELTQYAAALMAFVIAAEDASSIENGVCVPSERFVTTGRLHATTEYPRMIQILRELCGQGLISRFPGAAFSTPGVAGLLEEFLPGTGVDAQAKNRVFNFAWDLVCGANSARVALFENTNSTSPPVIRSRVYAQPQRQAWRDFVAGFVGVEVER